MGGSPGEIAAHPDMQKRAVLDISFAIFITCGLVATHQMVPRQHQLRVRCVDCQYRRSCWRTLPWHLYVSSFGTVCHGLISRPFTAPSWQTFTLLACGWALATRAPHHHHLSVAHRGHQRQALLALLCVSGWPAVHRALAPLGRGSSAWRPSGSPRASSIVIAFDDSTKKKAGRHIEGVAHYRNGAGSARQEYRTLRGLNFVWGHHARPPPAVARPQPSVSPSGCRSTSKRSKPSSSNVPYQSRSALAREIVNFVAAQLPARPIRVLGDGGYATKDYCPAVTGHGPRGRAHAHHGQALCAAAPAARPSAAVPPKKGARAGVAENLGPQTASGWQPHPTEAGALVQAWTGLWHTVLPGRLIRVVVVRRRHTATPRTPRQRKPRPPVEAFFTTDLTLSAGGDPGPVSRPVGGGNYHP